MEKKLGEAAKTYAQMQNPHWKVGKQKDLSDFSKGAQKPGQLFDEETTKKIKGWFGK